VVRAQKSKEFHPDHRIEIQHQNDQHENMHGSRDYRENRVQDFARKRDLIQHYLIEKKVHLIYRKILASIKTPPR
jgi:hypothetical protein